MAKFSYHRLRSLTWRFCGLRSVPDSEYSNVWASIYEDSFASVVGRVKAPYPPIPQRLLLHYYLAPFIWDGQVSAHAASNTFQVMQGYAFFTWQERGAGCELDGDGDPQRGEVEVEFRNPKRVPPRERTPLWTNTPKLSGKLLG